jgi:hypothetical protein
MPGLATTWRAHRIPVVGAVLAALVVAGIPAPASASLIGELSGTVTGGGVPLPNVWVTLTPVSESGEAAGSPKRTLTDASGRYEYPEVYDQAIKVHVRAPLFGDFVDTYWPQAFTFTQAGIIEISDWPVTADVDLPVGGSVSGRVVDLETGGLVQDARVSALIAESPGSGPVGIPDRDGAPGAFALSGLPPVPIRLRVRLPGNSPYLPEGPDEWYQGVRIDGASTTSRVTIGLRRGAEIRGTVRDDAGTPVAGASIKVVGCMPNCPLIVSSDGSGAYRIVGVSPGDRLGVVAWKGDTLVRQWYPGRDNASEASDIALGPGEVLDDVDFSLSRAAFMTVQVTGADSGEPLPGAIVLLVSATDSFERHFALRSRDGPGRMRLGPLHPGSYVLSVIPGRSNPGHGAVERATSPGIAPRGIIDLGPEDDVDFAVALPPLAGSTTAQDVADQDPVPAGGQGGEGTQGAGCSDGGRRDPAQGTSDEPPVGWPGLDRGFLAPTGQEGLLW